jgi:hypothetical protein
MPDVPWRSAHGTGLCQVTGLGANNDQAQWFGSASHLVAARYKLDPARMKCGNTPDSDNDCFPVSAFPRFAIGSV